MSNENESQDEFAYQVGDVIEYDGRRYTIYAYDPDTNTYYYEPTRGGFLKYIIAAAAVGIGANILSKEEPKIVNHNLLNSISRIRTEQFGFRPDFTISKYIQSMEKNNPTQSSKLRAASILLHNEQGAFGVGGISTDGLTSVAHVFEIAKYAYIPGFGHIPLDINVNPVSNYRDSRRNSLDKVYSFPLNSSLANLVASNYLTPIKKSFFGVSSRSKVSIMRPDLGDLTPAEVGYRDEIGDVSLIISNDNGKICSGRSGSFVLNSNHDLVGIVRAKVPEVTKEGQEDVYQILTGCSYLGFMREI